MKTPKVSTSLQAKCPDILTLWDYEKNEGPCPQELSIHSKKRVWWKCEKGHSWQSPDNGVAANGTRCPYCAGNRAIPGETDLVTLFPEVAADWDCEKNGALDPHSVAPASHANIWWKCALGHSWQAAPYARTSKTGTGCPYCAGKMAIPGETDLVTLFPEIAAEWDYVKNGDIDPNSLPPATHTKIWWKCALGHSYQSAPYSRTGQQYNSGCPYCTGKKAIPGETDLVTLFPEIAAEWDREKNGDLDPGSTSSYSHDKIWWKCAFGHGYQSAIYSRTGANKTGCPYCAGRKVLPGFNDLETLKPDLAGEWYQPLNGDLKPSDVTLGSNKKVWWCCSDHHVWEAYVYARTKFNGTGCPVCAGVTKAHKIKYYLDDGSILYKGHN